MSVRMPRSDVAALLLIVVSTAAMGDEPGPAPGRMYVIGRVLNPQGEPVPGAAVMAYAWNPDIARPLASRTVRSASTRFVSA